MPTLVASVKVWSVAVADPDDPEIKPVIDSLGER
jgi:hypothetical protein